ncbi:MAG: hypothetical protein EBX50_21275 [Chitinophagia bacterium]|nr:hypothetical protein [Chitinophagia bacterium]
MLIHDNQASTKPTVRFKPVLNEAWVALLWGLEAELSRVDIPEHIDSSPTALPPTFYSKAPTCAINKPS